MRYPGFCSGTYSGQSPTPAGDRCKNLFPERTTGAGNPESNIIFLGTPGLKLFAPLPGAFSVDSLFYDPLSQFLFAVSAGTLYFYVAGAGAFASAMPVGAGPYYWASGNNTGSFPTQVMLTCAGSGTAYIISSSRTGTLVPYVPGSGGTGTTGPITAAGFLGSAQCAVIDDFFISLVPNSRMFQLSSLLDGTQWDALDFGSASGASDNIITFAVDHRELWLFSRRRIEIYIDTGAASFSFERLSGTFIEVGCAAAGSVVRLDNTLYWLGQDERGAGMVWAANGYTPTRVSTHAVEYFINEYMQNGGISDAVAYAYQEGGHSFYVLHFPSATVDFSATGSSTPGVVKGATWVFDRATNLWHERHYWNQATNQAQAHLGRCHAFYNNTKHLVGDYQSGNVYQMSMDYFDDAGAFIQRERVAPHINNELQELYYHELALDMQTGVGNIAEPNPSCELRVSNDGGLTWGNARGCAMGQAGKYRTRVRWQMLGRARRRAFKWTTSARVPICLVDAYLRVTQGSH